MCFFTLIISEKFKKLIKIQLNFSLFGAYRYKNPLPWDTDVDFFVRAEEIEKIDQTEFMAQFKQKGRVSKKSSINVQIF